MKALGSIGIVEVKLLGTTLPDVEGADSKLIDCGLVRIDAGAVPCDVLSLRA